MVCKSLVFNGGRQQGKNHGAIYVLNGFLELSSPIPHSKQAYLDWVAQGLFQFSAKYL